MMIKQCSGCKEYLPFSDFYVRPNNRDGHSYYCKVCNRGNNATYKYNYDYVRHEESVVLQKLADNGIAAIPGKFRRDLKYIDIVAFGFIKIEAKLSSLYNNRYIWHLNPINAANKLSDNHFIIFVTADEGAYDYYVFPTGDPILYKSGKQKTGLTYIPDIHRKTVKRNSLIDDKFMAAYHNKFSLITDYLLDTITQ